MRDPYLHLLLDDDEITAQQNVRRMVHTFRRDSLEPVLAPQDDEGTAIGYASLVRHPDTERFHLWYSCQCDRAVRQAISDDLRTWDRCGIDMTKDVVRNNVDNLGLVPIGPHCDQWFKDALWAGFGYFCDKPLDDQAIGLYLIKVCPDQPLQVRFPRILPGVGDRSSLTYDPDTEDYLLISRPSEQMPGYNTRALELKRCRIAQLWRSRNLVDWDDHGIILKPDDLDPDDLQIYGVQPFPYGQGFLAFVEVYYADTERLETELAYSRDGSSWRRLTPRTPVLPMGAEGAWDSHWTVPTFNAPIADGDRLQILYSGAGTKHASGPRHRRAIGLASIRRDGWVSLEGGRTDPPASFVTTPLPLEKPMQLEVNANCETGSLVVEVLRSDVGHRTEAVAGHDAKAGRLENFDSIAQPVTWGKKAVVKPTTTGTCYLRFSLTQGSLFSYRWFPAT